MAKKPQKPKRTAIATKATKIEREKYLQRLEQRIIRGVTNKHELAAAFDKPVAQIAEDIQEVRDRWLDNAPKEIEQAKITRIRQLEHLGMLALDSYQRSRQDVEEITTVERRCLACAGTGKIKRHSQASEEECPDCGGKGVVAVETRKLKGQAGDASFLKMAKEAFIEAGKIEGVIATGAMTLRNITQTMQQLPDGDVKMEAMEITMEAPLDVLIRAKALLEEIHQGRKKGNVKVIEGRVVDSPSTLAETRKNEPGYEIVDIDAIDNLDNADGKP